MNKKPERKCEWGFFRCNVCRAFARVKCGKCEHCGARPPKKRKQK
jgi:hypothetical protein